MLISVSIPPVTPLPSLLLSPKLSYGQWPRIPSSLKPPLTSSPQTSQPLLLATAAAFNEQLLSSCSVAGSVLGLQIQVNRTVQIALASWSL